MVYETEDKTRHPVRRGKYKVHRDKPAQRNFPQNTSNKADDQAVDEAVDESFPASDPPLLEPYIHRRRRQNPKSLSAWHLHT